ncbi:uncharacterized protein ACRADG_001558 [Cochliomyia hominivorax]
MKFVFHLSILILTFVYVLGSTEECRLCEDCPDCGNNMPKCNSSTVGKKIRNYWQNDLYWICEKPTGRAEARRCGNDLFFQEELGECVHRSEYHYTCPCDTCPCSKQKA